MRTTRSRSASAAPPRPPPPADDDVDAVVEPRPPPPAHAQPEAEAPPAMPDAAEGAALANPNLRGRRADHHAVALRLGARYAVYNEGGAEAAEGGPGALAPVHGARPGAPARELGAWATAAAMLDAREEAAAARLEEAAGRRKKKARAGGDGGGGGGAWRPTRPPGARVLAGDRVPPLADLAAAAIAVHMDAVTSVAGLPDGVRARLAAAAQARRALDARAARVLLAGAPGGDVSLPDASGLDAAGVAGLLVDVGTGGGLESLALGFAGRGFGDAAARTLARLGPHPLLTRVTLGGAYRLSDGGLADLLAATPALEALALPSASAIGGGAIARLAALTPRLTSLDLTHCRGVPADALLAALTRAGGLPRLASLTVDGLPSIDDAFLTAAAPHVPALTHLSVRQCGGVTEAGLLAVAAARGGGLASLAADGAAVSDAGLAALVDAARGLRSLSLDTCADLTDTGLAAAVARLGSGLAHLSAARVPALAGRTLAALTRSCPSLASLDMSWCRRAPPDAVGALLDAGKGTLEKVTLYGCSQIGADVVNGHSNDRVVLVGAVARVEGVLDKAVARLAVPA